VVSVEVPKQELTSSSFIRLLCPVSNKEASTEAYTVHCTAEIKTMDKRQVRQVPLSEDQTSSYYDRCIMAHESAIHSE
jgi:hypothetical protein